MKGNTLETIHAAGYIDIDTVIAKQSQFAKYQWVSLSIGNDDKIYCLFAEKIPERIKGMFVPTTNNSRYIAYVFTVDWHSGEVYSSQIVDFGVVTINVHFLQPIWDKFLLLCARTHYNDGNPEQNALIVEEGGNKHSHFCLGDGIQDCIVDSQNIILTSYFDEGVFGNYGWGKPIGTSGLVKWSATGEKVWENKDHDICDCYAMNIDDLDHLWFYYYSEFNLVKTNYKTETIFNPQISGSSGFLISQDQNSLLFHKGYNEKGFCIVNILNRSKLSEPKDCQIVFGDHAIDTQQFTFRSSKAVFVDTDRRLYFVNWYQNYLHTR